MKKYKMQYKRNTKVLTKVARRNIPEYGIVHTQRRENLKSYLLVLFANKGVYTFS
jgi:hypothetical protein